MSRSSEKTRAERRARSSDMIAQHLTEEGDEMLELAEQAMASEPHAKAWSLFCKPGEGWVWVELELPQSVVEQYATKVSVPEVKGVVLAQIDAAIGDYAARGVG